MSKIRITITPEYLHERHVLSLGFEKGYDFCGKVKVPPIAQWNVEMRNCASLPPGTIKSTIRSQSPNFCIRALQRNCIGLLLGHIVPNASGINPFGIHYHFWKRTINNVFSNRVNIHVSNRSLANIKSLLEILFDDNKHENSNIQTNT